VGVVRDAVVGWLADVKWPGAWFTPVVAETYDGMLNDINGFHVKPEHAMRAIQTAATGPVAEGNVGGGVGMQCFGFKGGTGTASRVVEMDGKAYTVGVLVQCNFGMRPWLRVAGAPVGEELAGKYLPETRGTQTAAANADVAPRVAPGQARGGGHGPHGRCGQQRLGRHLHRLLDRERKCAERGRQCDQRRNDAQRQIDPDL
jgi:hypothetical protein